MQHSQAGDGVGGKPSERRGPVRTEQIDKAEDGLRRSHAGLGGG